MIILLPSKITVINWSSLTFVVYCRHWRMHQQLSQVWSKRCLSEYRGLIHLHLQSWILWKWKKCFGNYHNPFLCFPDLCILVGCDTMIWMLRALWLVVAHDLLESRYMDDVTLNLFSLFCSTWHAVLKMFVRLFRTEASESFGKSLAGAIYKEEKWRNGDQKSYWLLDNA